MARIEHFALFAADAPALKDFYINVMGMRLLLSNAGPPPGFFLGDDRGTALEIIGRPADVSGVNTRYVCHIAFWVDDYAAESARLKGLGLEFETETAVDTSEFRTSFFRDPDGNRLQIVWRRTPLGGSV